jgi:purine-binding chemotaxis protein CheW
LAAAEPTLQDAAGGPGAEPLCLFERAGRLFAIAVVAVREAINGEEASPIPQAPPHMPGAVNVRGDPLTLLLIDEWIGVRRRPYRPTHQILVVEANGVRVGVVVDRVRDIRLLGVPIRDLPRADGRGPLGLRTWKDGDEEIVVLDAGEVVGRAAALAAESYRRLPQAWAAEREASVAPAFTTDQAGEA